MGKVQRGRYVGMQVMGIHNTKYITTNDSRSLANGKISIADVAMEIGNFDFSEYSVVQRRAIISWAGLEKETSFGPAVGSKKISEGRISLEITSPGPVIIEFGSETFLLESDPVHKGFYILSFEVFLDAPLKTLGDVPDRIKPMVQYTEVIRLILNLESVSDGSKAERTEKKPVYEGYGQLGFFIADLKKMNDFVVSRLGEGVVNLKDAFCETEIANELFDEGLMVLVWGMTPWVYYVYGLDSKEEMSGVPSIPQPQFSGTYKFSPEIVEPSIVPGNFLLDWPNCLNLEFPKLSLQGSGDLVDINVNVMGYYISGIGIGPSLAVITACRKENPSPVNPLLTVDIESVDPELCF